MSDPLPLGLTAAGSFEANPTDKEIAAATADLVEHPPIGVTGRWSRVEGNWGAASYQCNGVPLPESASEALVAFPDGSMSPAEIVWRNERRQMADHGHHYEICIRVPMVRWRARGVVIETELSTFPKVEVVR